jgi:hypothetical protein
MFEVKGKNLRFLYSLNPKADPDGTKLSYPEKGWMTDDSGEQWFDQVFLKHCCSHIE